MDSLLLTRITAAILTRRKKLICQEGWLTFRHLTKQNTFQTYFGPVSKNTVGVFDEWKLPVWERLQNQFSTGDWNQVFCPEPHKRTCRTSSGCGNLQCHEMQQPVQTLLTELVPSFMEILIHFTFPFSFINKFMYLIKRVILKSPP